MSDDTRIGLEKRPGPPAPLIYAAVFGKLVAISAVMVGLSLIDLPKYNLGFFATFLQVALLVAQLGIIATVFMDLPFEERWNGIFIGFGVALGALICVMGVIDTNTRGHADALTANGVMGDEHKRGDEMKAAAKHVAATATPAKRWDVAEADEATWQPPPPPPPMPEPVAIPDGGVAAPGDGGNVEPAPTAAGDAGVAEPAPVDPDPAPAPAPEKKAPSPAPAPANP